MKFYAFLTILFLGTSETFGFTPTPQPDSLRKKVVFVIIDGISADQLENAHTPNLDQIGQQGSYKDSYVGGQPNTYSETPTISAVGYNSLLTGTWANKHNVWGNSIKEPNYHYPTIFRLFKDQYPNGTTAIFSSWLDNRTKLAGDGLKQTGSLKIDFSFDGLEYDSINFPHDEKRNFMKLIDFSVADHTAQAIAQNAPDLTWVYLEYTDDIGHAHGDSPQLNAAISFEDGLIGKISKAIELREEKYSEDWLLIITTDHGRSAKDGKGHGGQSPRERSTWIVMNKKISNSFHEEYRPPIVDIMPTMADFLEIKIPEPNKREIDGVSLISSADAIDLTAKVRNGILELYWKNLSKHDQIAKVYLSTSNYFKVGKPDNYYLLSSTPLQNEKVSIDLNDKISNFYKVTLETSNTTLNRWIIKN